MAYNYGFSSSSSSNDSQVPLFCPKPRRIRQLNGVDPVGPHSTFHLRHQMDPNDSFQDVDVFDMFLTKDAYDLKWDEDDSEMPSSPPFFCGSPPSRSTNPLIRDAIFLQEKSNNTLLTATTPLPFLPSSPQPISPTATNGKRRESFFHSATNFGPMPAAVRIEGGFDCLDLDSRNGCSSIPAFA